MGAGTRSVRHAVAALLVAVALLLPAMGWAQSASAGLRGRAPANTEVSVRNVATGLIRRTTSGADGIYSLVGLPVMYNTAEKGLLASWLATEAFFAPSRPAIEGLFKQARRAEPVVSGRKYDSRLLRIPPIQHRRMPDAAHDLALRAVRKQVQRFVARLALHARDANLHQLVILQGARGFGDHRGARAGLADENDRFEGMAQAPQMSALFFGKTHFAPACSGATLALPAARCAIVPTTAMAHTITGIERKSSSAAAARPMT